MTEREREQLLRKLRIGDIQYPGRDNPGCAGARGGGGAPGRCQGEVVAAALKYYQGPKPHRARIFVCRLHAQLEQTEPLTGADRAELIRRREVWQYWDRVMRENRARAGMAGGL